MPKYVNVNGVWKQEGSGYVNVNGVWKPKSTDYVNVNGVWKNASPYAKAQYYGVARTQNQSGSHTFTNNADGSYTLSGMGNYYAGGDGEYDGKVRLAFSTPYQLKNGDVISAYGKFMYGNTGAYIGFCSSMPSTTENSISAFDIEDFYCTGDNGTTWKSYSTTYTGYDRIGYLHIEIIQYYSYVTTTAIFSNFKINGVEILNTLA